MVSEQGAPGEADGMDGVGVMDQDAEFFTGNGASDRCVTHATFVQWDGGKDGPSESRDSPRARCTARLPRLLPAPPTPTWGTFMTSATATTTTTASTERPACRPEGWEGVRTGRVRAIVRFRSLERASARRSEGRESRKGKERLESCNAQTATTNV